MIYDTKQSELIGKNMRSALPDGDWYMNLFSRLYSENAQEFTYKSNT